MTETSLTHSGIALLRYLHIGAGGIALLVGTLPMISRKGGKLHVKSGKLFYLTILIASISGLVLGVWQHNMLLFLVGLLTIWSASLGQYAIKQSGYIGNNKAVHLACIVSFMAIMLAILVYRVVAIADYSSILTIFAGISLLTTIPEWRFYFSPKHDYPMALRRHVGHTMGAIIASWTAFFVVSNVFSLPTANWLLPTLIGSILIAYWQNKIKNGWWPTLLRQK